MKNWRAGDVLDVRRRVDIERAGTVCVLVARHNECEEHGYGGGRATPIPLPSLAAAYESEQGDRLLDIIHSG